MSARIRILAGTVRPGGATCLFPAINELRGRADVDVRVIAHAHAADVLAMHGVPFHDPTANGSKPLVEDAVRKMTSEYEPDLILSGAFGPIEGGLDFWLLLAAQRFRIPSYAVLDAWMNYAMRFADVDTGHPTTHLPDRMAVMDEQTVAELAGVGVPSDRLDVTGHPFLSVVRQCSNDVSVRAKHREQLMAADGEQVVVFFSEPLRWGEEQGLNDPLGYSEFDAFDLMVNAIGDTDRPRLLIVKEHPRHASLKLPDRIGQTRVLRCETKAVLDLIIAADVVVGMSTTLLVYAYLMGKRVVAIQPGALPDRNCNVLTRRDIIPNCETIEAVTEALNGSAGDMGEALACTRKSMKWEDDPAAATAECIMRFLGPCRTGEHCFAHKDVNVNVNMEASVGAVRSSCSEP